MTEPTKEQLAEARARLDAAMITIRMTYPTFCLTELATAIAERDAIARERDVARDRADGLQSALDSLVEACWRRVDDTTATDAYKMKTLGAYMRNNYPRKAREAAPQECPACNGDPYVCAEIPSRHCNATVDIGRPGEGENVPTRDEYVRANRDTMGVLPAGDAYDRKYNPITRKQYMQAFVRDQIAAMRAEILEAVADALQSAVMVNFSQTSRDDLPDACRRILHAAARIKEQANAK